MRNTLLFSLFLMSGGFLLQAQDCNKLIWADEFSGTSLDSSRWNIDLGNGCPELCGWGNNEQQYYSDSPENLKVENGRLLITAREDSLGGLSYSSAKITSFNKGDFRYGRFEASMKLPTSQGMWPAFWLLPTDQVYGEWPQSGEMDVMELIGSNPGQVFGTIHTGFPYTFNSGYFDLPQGESFADTFHVFSMEWDPDSITWFVDGVKYHQLSPDTIGPWDPFQEDFHLILNLAVGGNLPGPVDSTTILPQTMEVDYVRVYNRPERLRVRGQQPILGASGIGYQTFDIPGATYTWTVPGDAMITSGQGTNAIMVDWGCTPGNVSLELQTDCDTVTMVYDIAAFAQPRVDGPSVVAEVQTSISYQLSQAGNGTYTWEVPADATILSGQGTDAITVDWGCTSGNVVVTYNSSCGSTLTDTVEVALRTYAITGFATVQANSMAQTYSTSDIPGATYTWSVPSDATITMGQGTPSIQVDFGSTGGMVSVEIGTSCGPTTYSLPITIDEATVYVNFESTDLEFGDFGGVDFFKVENPDPSGINVSDSVGQVNKNPGAQVWGGVFADLPGEMALDVKPLVSMKVYSTVSGEVNFKLEDQTTAAPFFEAQLDYDSTQTGQWVELIWDFTGQPANTFDRIALFFGFLDTDTSFWYFDDVLARPDPNANTSLDAETLSAIQVYPNPTSGPMQVNLKDVFPPGESFTLEILDLQGRSLDQQEYVANGEPLSLDLESYPNGLYFLTFRSQKTVYLKSVEKLD